MPVQPLTLLRMPRIHRVKATLLLLVAIGLLLLALHAGYVKAWAVIDWMDVIGEGGTTGMALVWLVLVLSTRPQGRVTTLLYAGGVAYFSATWLDFLDEFIHYNPNAAWMGWVESLPAPVGMILLTVGLFGWRREQVMINDQLRRRERFYREHRLVDYLTKLYSADYLLLVLRREVRLHLARQAPLALLALDIDDFAAFNRRYGEGRGDARLRQVSEVLLAGLRGDDLLCRFAGDRFMALLPNTTHAQAEEMAAHLQQQIAQLVGTTAMSRREGRCAVTVGCVAMTGGDEVSAEALMQRCQRDLDEHKGRRLRLLAQQAG